MADDATLLVNGKQYLGWEDVSIKRSMKAISGSFSLSVTTKWAQQQTPWQINPGDECRILIGQDEVINGFVDSTNPKLSKDRRDFGASGRDKTADLVDCTPETGSFNSTTLFGLISKLCSPFGITVTDLVKDSHKFPNISVNQGEGIFDIMDKYAKLRGVLLSGDGKGGLVICRAGTGKASTEIVEGMNLLEADASYDFKERYSKIITKSQSIGVGEEGPDLSQFAPKGQATDAQITRLRPKVIVCDGAADAGTCLQRARWEVSVRAGRSTIVNVAVPGWRQGNGKLWTVNELVRLRSPYLGLDIDLLISEVTYTKSSSETRTQMQLVPASAFTVDPTLIEKKEPWRQLYLKETARK